MSCRMLQLMTKSKRWLAGKGYPEFSARSAMRMHLPMKKTVFLALALLTLPAFAQEPAAKIDISKLPKETRVVDDVIVPVPSEIFSVLDKLGRPNWVAVQRPIKGVAQPVGSPPQQALYLGTVIAEGFIAVEANDAEEVKNIGRSVLNLSKALGVQKAVTKRANAIINEADASNWPGVRRELDGALSEVKGALKQLNSADLADLVAIGGWSRGTEALCEVVNRDYSRDGADLLHQPVLLNSFDAKLKAFKARIKKEALVGKAQETLKAIRPLMGTPEGTVITKETVAEIGKIISALIKAIQTK
jgi:hypothetical protein